MLSGVPFWTRQSVVCHGSFVIVVWRYYSTWSAHSEMAANGSWVLSYTFSYRIFEFMPLSVVLEYLSCSDFHVKQLGRKTVSTLHEIYTHKSSRNRAGNIEPSGCYRSQDTFRDIFLLSVINSVLQYVNWSLPRFQKFHTSTLNISQGYICIHTSMVIEAVSRAVWYNMPTTNRARNQLWKPGYVSPATGLKRIVSYHEYRGYNIESQLYRHRQKIDPD